MNSLFLFLHVVAAIALVGPLMLTPRWTGLMNDDVGRAALKDLHRQTGIAGWLLVASGLALLARQHWTGLGAPWMQFSAALFLGAQTIDHWWADRHEDRLEHGAAAPADALRFWLICKVAVYLVIVALMVIEPA